MIEYNTAAVRFDIAIVIYANEDASNHEIDTLVLVQTAYRCKNARSHILMYCIVKCGET